MRLSDMQCSRNLIDKALEVNQTALKFCKDKDELMKEELEKQKTRLIERKLMQSIERIEKGWCVLHSIFAVLCFDWKFTGAYAICFLVFSLSVVLQVFCLNLSTYVFCIGFE